METLIDYLIIDRKRYGTNLDPHQEFGFHTEILEVEENPFYLPFGDKGVHHWELVILPTYQDEEEPEAGMKIMDDVSPLRFKMTSRSLAPTMEQFSEHIKRELRAVLNALDLDNVYVWNVNTPDNRDRIELHQVYKFLKNIHKDYTKTEDFLKDYDHYVDRMYHDCKWIEYLMFGVNYMFAMGWEFPIGEHLLSFLDIGKYSDYYEMSE